MNDEQAKLVNDHLHLAKATARRFMWARDVSPLTFDDLRQEAVIGLIKAAKTYSPSGAAFKTWAVRLMRQRVSRIIQPFTGKFALRLWNAKGMNAGSDIEDRSTIEEKEPWIPTKSATEHVSKLPTSVQSMIVRLFVFGETGEEIGAAVGTSKQWVYECTSRYLALIRKRMTDVECHRIS